MRLHVSLAGDHAVSIFHVYPEHDLVPHETEGDSCPCGPRVEYLDEGVVVIHNAWDERIEGIDKPHLSAPMMRRQPR